MQPPLRHAHATKKVLGFKTSFKIKCGLKSVLCRKEIACDKIVPSKSVFIESRFESLLEY